MGLNPRQALEREIGKLRQEVSDLEQVVKSLDWKLKQTQEYLIHEKKLSLIIRYKQQAEETFKTLNSAKNKLGRRQGKLRRAEEELGELRALGLYGF